MKWVLLALALAVAATGVALQPTASAASQPAKRISIEFRGRLKDAVKKIAAEGGINLVAGGDLNEEAEVYLKGVTAEEALKTVANAYHLRIEKSGNIWTLRRMTAAERLTQTPPLPPGAPPSPGAPAETARETESKPSESDSKPDEGSSDAALEQAAQEAAQALAKSTGEATKPVDPRLVRRKLKELKELRKDFHRHPFAHSKGDRVGQGSLVVYEGETVHKAAALGGSLTVNGTTTADAVALGGSLSVNGHVGGDAVAIGGGVHLGPKAVVDGNVVAIGGQVTKEEGAEVGGDQASSGSLASLGIDSLMQTIKRDADRSRSDDGEGGSAGSFWLNRRHFGFFPSFFLWFGSLFLIGFLLMVFAPHRMQQIETDLKSEPLKCGVAGFVGLLALVPLTLILVFTIIGIIFVPVVWFLACLGIAMGMSAVANEIGMRLPLFRGRKTQALVLALGTLILLVVSRVPYIGPLAIALLMMLAFGAAIRTRFGQAPKGVPQPI